MIFFVSCSWSSTLNKKPPFPLSKISLGPVGHSLEIKIF